MTKIHNFNIVTTFLCLWLAVYLSTESEVYLASFFILTVGLLHGSNDIKIIGKVLKKKSINYYRILFFYVLAVVLGAMMFYFITVFALIYFVLVGVFHALFEKGGAYMTGTRILLRLCILKTSSAQRDLSKISLELLLVNSIIEIRGSGRIFKLVIAHFS